jgi:hypothetical protein
MKHGPNVNKLIAAKFAKDLTPPGSTVGTVAAAIIGGKLGPAAKLAEEWVMQAIGLVRLAAGPNPWKDKPDEEIAGELLRKIEERKPQP